jgi:hypothetical protein
MEINSEEMMHKVLVIFFLLINSTFAFDVNKNDVEQMLKSMQQSGVINEQQAKEASKKLKNLSDNEWDQIKDKGRTIASEYKEKNKNVENSAPSAAQNIDFNSNEFKNIQKQVQEAMGQ